MGRKEEVVISRRRMVALGIPLLASIALYGCSVRKTGSQSGDAGSQADAAGSQADAADGESGAAGSRADSSAQTKVTVAPTEKNVRLIGRTFEEDGATWLPQSGSAVEFVFTGSRIELEMVGDQSVENKPDLCPRYAVLVDGTVVVDETLTERTRVVEVPTDGPLAGAVIEVILLSEAIQGAVGVRSIIVATDESAPVVPSAAKATSIGFVGDSITCAYGVEGTAPDDDFKTTTENFMKSYAYLAACELDADYDTVCYSGYGVASGWSADGRRNDQMLVPPLYDLVVRGREQRWDFAAHPRDVIVVNLGTNDDTYTGTNEARREEFSQGYTEFIAHIRELNPNSLIVCTMGTMGCEELYPFIERAVRIHCERTGDTQVICYKSDPIDMEKDGCGTGEHPNEITQRKSAQKLVSVIRQTLSQR